MAENGELSKHEFSKRFFGNKGRLDILCTIAGFSIDPPEPEQFTAAIILERCPDASQWSIHGELKNLHGAGLVDLVARAGIDSNSNVFVRSDDSLWEIFQVAAESIRVRFGD